ncbi:hypothetical protein SOVF_134390 [Spinacia oleracea]|nr:hypothetical protein SOVF_134390 [Spinacia oleracea]
MMLDLQSGARRSKRDSDLQYPPPELNDRGEHFLTPTRNKTRRGGGGRGRGAYTTNVVAKAAIRARQTDGVGRGRRVRVKELDPDVPGEGLPQVPHIEVAGATHNQVEGSSDKDIGME